MPGHDRLAGGGGEPESRQPRGPPQEDACSGNRVPGPLARCAALIFSHLKSAEIWWHSVWRGLSKQCLMLCLAPACALPSAAIHMSRSAVTAVRQCSQPGCGCLLWLCSCSDDSAANSRARGLACNHFAHSSCNALSALNEGWPQELASPRDAFAQWIPCVHRRTVTHISGPSPVLRKWPRPHVLLRSARCGLPGA